MNDQTDNPTTRSDLAPPLPRTPSAMLAVRKIKAQRSLNDLVEDSYLRVLDGEKGDSLLSYCSAVWDSDAKEGSTAADDIMAAMIIRQDAVDNKVIGLSDKNLATIAHSLRIVLRRYGISRKERKYQVGGQIVAPQGNGGDE